MGVRPKVPRYHFTYEVQPIKDGVVKVKTESPRAKWTKFAMFCAGVRRFGSGMVRLNQNPDSRKFPPGHHVRSGSAPRKSGSQNYYKDVLER